MGKIAKILPIPKDNYDPDETYYSLDWVRYDKKIWVCKTDHITGITPEEGENWMLLVVDGGGCTINDADTNDNETWSSKKISEAIEAKTVVTDNSLDKESTNPIQNGAVATKFESVETALNDKANSSDITALQNAINSKANSSDITTLQNALKGKANSSHTHAISDITGLQGILDDKAGTDVATTSADGLMSATDKAFLNLLRSKLNGVTLATPALSGTTLNLTSIEVK